MITLRLSAADLGRVRFAAHPHPIGAAAMASQVLRDAAPPAPLRHLLPARGLLPDFVTPYQGLDSAAAGVEAIRATPRRRVRADVARAYAHLPATPWRRRLADGDREAVELVASSLGAWFDAAIRPQWNDLVLGHRRWVDRAARAWALSGVDGVLGGLHPAVRWRAPVLEVDTWWSADLGGTGEGLVLVPSPFAGPRPRLLVARGRPALLVFPTVPPAAPRKPAAPGVPAAPGRPAAPGVPAAPPAAPEPAGFPQPAGDTPAGYAPAGPPPIAATNAGVTSAPSRSTATPAAGFSAPAEPSAWTRSPAGRDALARLLGRTRAAVLCRLGEPGRHTTTALAHAAGISLPSASEHTAALRAAGLVTSERDGGAVVHRLTPLGVEVLAGGG